MKRRKAICILGVILLTTASLQADVIPGRWELVDGLAPGTAITVKLKAGDRIDCDFKESGPQGLTLIDEDRSERRIPKSEVSTITSRRKYDDSALDGVGIGAGVGVATGLILGAIGLGGCRGGSCFAIWPLICGAAGAGIGAVADALHKGNEVIYRAK